MYVLRAAFIGIESHHVGSNPHTDDLTESADGTVKKAYGKVGAQLSLGMHARLIPTELLDDSECPGEAVIEEAPEPTEELQDRPVRYVVQTTFYIFDGIAVDVLIGAHSIKSLNLYTEHTDALTSRADAGLQDDMVFRVGLLGKSRNRPSRDSLGSSQEMSNVMHDINLIKCSMLIPDSFICKMPRATRRSRPARECSERASNSRSRQSQRRSKSKL